LILRQYYLGCLAHASYLVADERRGIAAVVDPQRDVDEYVEDAHRLELELDRPAARTDRDERAQLVLEQALRNVDLHGWSAAISDDGCRLQLTGGSVSLDLGLSDGIAATSVTAWRPASPSAGLRCCRKPPKPRAPPTQYLSNDGYTWHPCRSRIQRRTPRSSTRCSAAPPWSSRRGCPGVSAPLSRRLEERPGVASSVGGIQD
jgi:hypothetical protein